MATAPTFDRLVRAALIMEGIDLTSIYTTIGGVLGTPAAIAFFYLWNKVKELEKRLDAGQTRFDRMDAELKEINRSLNIIIGKVDTMLRRSGHTPEDGPC